MSNQAQSDDEFRSYISDFESYLHNIGGEARQASPDGTLSETMTSSAENYEDSGAWQRQDNMTSDAKRLSYCGDIYDEHKRLHDIVVGDEKQDDNDDQYEFKCNQDYMFKESASSISASAAAAHYINELEYSDDHAAEEDLDEPSSTNGGLYEDDPTDRSPINDAEVEEVGAANLLHSYVIDEEDNSDVYGNDRYREPEVIQYETYNGTVDRVVDERQDDELENGRDGCVEEFNGVLYGQRIEYQDENNQQEYVDDEDYENDYENVGDKRCQGHVGVAAEAAAEFEGQPPIADCARSNCINDDADPIQPEIAEEFDEELNARGNYYEENDESHYYNNDDQIEADSHYKNENEADPIHDEDADEGQILLLQNEGSGTGDTTHQPTTSFDQQTKPRHHVTFSIDSDRCDDEDEDGGDADSSCPVELTEEQRQLPDEVSTPERRVDDETARNQQSEEDTHLPAERGRIKVLLAQWREFEQQQILSGRARSSSSSSSSHVRSRSCGPSSGRQTVAITDPYENRCIDDMSNGCGRRSRWNRDRNDEENNAEDVDQDENRSISRAAILAKFENFGSAAGNKAPIPTHKKTFKWTVKEPIALQRPVGLRVS